MDFAELKSELQEGIKHHEEELDLFRRDMLRKFESAQDHAILVAIGRLNDRLDSIEARLPELEEES